MAGISHATGSVHKGVIAVLLVALLAVLTVAALALTTRDSGGSPSTPNPAAHHAVARSLENCSWRPNGWYC
jgi:hypothetical protein